MILKKFWVSSSLLCFIHFLFFLSPISSAKLFKDLQIKKIPTIGLFKYPNQSSTKSNSHFLAYRKIKKDPCHKIKSTHEIINSWQKKNQGKRRYKGDKNRKKWKGTSQIIFFFLEDKVKLCYLKLLIVIGSVSQ